ncbi:MAG TPA: EamA family transporter [Streptosporangiaceae bacterium]|nr:EamA family transporter [Streptosporangiaceae bacterium]
MLAVILAVASSLGYGVADFAGGLATRAVPVLRVVAVTAPVSLVADLALLPLLGGRWSAGALGWGAASGLASAAVFALLYQSLALGPMGVLSPVTAVVSAVLPVAVGLVEGERLGALGAAGIALAIVAVFAVSAGTGERGRRPSTVALVLAVAAGGAIAAQLVCLNQTPHDSGVVPLVVGRAVSAAVLLGAVALRRDGGPPGRAAASALRLAVGAGIFDAAANLAFLLAVRSGSLVVVAVITALYPAGTVLLARRFLGERLTRTQLAGLLTAAAAVTVLAVG